VVEGYYMPLVRHTADDHVLAYRNASGISIYNLNSGDTTLVPESASGTTFTRGAMAMDKGNLAWQFGQTKLSIFRRGIGNVVSIAPLPNPLLSGMCIADGFVLTMGANKNLYLFDIMAKNYTSTLPYTTDTGRSVTGFNCYGHKVAVATSNNIMLIADWEEQSGIVNIPQASRQEVAILGTPKQVVINDTYVAFVNESNDIYVIELNNGNASYKVASQNPPSQGYAQIADLHLDGAYLVWSDDSYGYWTVFYADLSSRNPVTQSYRYSQMSSSSIKETSPTVDGLTGLVYWPKFTLGDDQPPVLFRGEVGAELRPAQ